MQRQLVYFEPVLRIRIRKDYHHFEKRDPDPHQSGKLDRIRIKVKKWKP
jgi:hypothetical protein